MAPRDSSAAAGWMRPGSLIARQCARGGAVQVTVLLLVGPGAACWPLCSCGSRHLPAHCLGFGTGRLRAPFKIMCCTQHCPSLDRHRHWLLPKDLQLVIVCCEVGRLKYPVASLVCLFFFVCDKHTACSHLWDYTRQLLGM